MGLEVVNLEDKAIFQKTGRARSTISMTHSMQKWFARNKKS